MAKTALILTTTASQIDCSQMSAITDLVIVSTEPANTTTKYALKTAAGMWRRWNTTSSEWENLPTQEITATSLLEEGNTKAELLAIAAANLQWLTGSKNDAAVAIGMTDTATEPPSVTSITVTGRLATRFMKRLLRPTVLPFLPWTVR